jgi:hypothetical protein
MIGGLESRTNLHVRTTLPIVVDGNTVAVHFWFDARSGIDRLGKRDDSWARSAGGSTGS